MKLTIELDREVDGRWIADIPELNIIVCGDSRQDAIQKAQAAAREIVLDRSLTPNCPQIQRTQRSTSPLEFARPHGLFKRDHEEERMGRLPLILPRL